MKPLLTTLTLLAISLFIPTTAWETSTSNNLAITVTSVTQPMGSSTLYSQWSNFPQSSSFFPIAIWAANPNRVLGSGAPYTTVALSAQAAKMNIFLGTDDWPGWPSGVCSGDNDNYLATIKSGNMYVIPNVNTSNNTSPDSVSSILCLASTLNATAKIIGYLTIDEPQSNCSTVLQVPTTQATVQGYDTTRPAMFNNTDWPLDHGYCPNGNPEALRSSAIASWDLYPLISPWQGYPGTPQDSMWVQGYSVVLFTQNGRAGQPQWAAVETGTDALGYSSQNGSTCNASTNLCTPNNNEYRATNEQVNAEAWMSLINGANGIYWFCDDSTGAAYAFCLGEQTGGSDNALANSIQANLTYIDTTILSLAQQLNATTAGICTMNNGTGYTNFTTSCSNGILTMSTGTSTVPGSAMVRNYDGVLYLFADSDRNGSATMTFTLSGYPGKIATVVYDSNAKYDPSHSTVGSTFTLNGSGQFSDTFGANGHNYQPKIYKVQ